MSIDYMNTPNVGGCPHYDRANSFCNIVKKSCKKTKRQRYQCHLRIKMAIDCRR